MVDRPDCGHFNSFGTEILRLIAQHLPHKQDLANLARVSRRLKPVATEALYEELHVTSLARAEGLIVAHGLHLPQPKVNHIAQYTRVLRISVCERLNCPRPVLHPELVDYTSTSPSAREEEIMTYFLKACKQDTLRSLDFYFDACSSAGAQLQLAKILESDGLTCRRLSLAGCHYDAIPAFLQALDPSLEELEIISPRHVPTRDQLFRKRSDLFSAYCDQDF